MQPGREAFACARSVGCERHMDAVSPAVGRGARSV